MTWHGSLIPATMASRAQMAFLTLGSQMELLYFGKLCDARLFASHPNKQQPYFVAQYSYEKALCDEWRRSAPWRQRDICIHQTHYFPRDELFFRRRDPSKNYLWFVNLPYLRELSYFVAACAKIFSFWWRSPAQARRCIFASCHFPPVSLAIVLLGKILRIPKVVTFTDLASFSYSPARVRKMKLYKRILMGPYVALTGLLQRSYDAYVLFSKGMARAVNPGGKPQVVVEGMFDDSGLRFAPPRPRARALAHAGTLNAEVGIGKILEVFAAIRDPALELWLLGKGDMVEEIELRRRHDGRIKYLGFLPRAEVFEVLAQAALLVNLRDPRDVYTKYSFPSKMFEYLASGTPVFTTKLEGIPSDYYAHMYSSESYDSGVLAREIEDILALDEKERLAMGEEAKRYVREEKSSARQARRICELVMSLERRGVGRAGQSR